MVARSLTILVPTNDRPEVLERVWPSWLGQDGLVQVVIVDDGSAQDYGPVFARITQGLATHGVEVNVVRLPERRGAPAARNAALPLCRGDEILTLDDDIVLTPNVVHLCRARRPSAMNAIVGPRVVYLRDGESEAEADSRSRRDDRCYFDRTTVTLRPWVTAPGVERVPFVTAVALWPRELFDRGLRYFDGYLGNGYREETDPQLEAQRTYGASVFFVPTAHVFHLPPSLAYQRRSGQRRGNPLWFEWWVARNNAVFVTRHGRFLREQFGVHPRQSWLALMRTRFTFSRLRAFRRQRASNKRAAGSSP